MKQVGLSKECRDLEMIISNLEAGQEKSEIEDSSYTLEEAIDYLKEYLQELRKVDAQLTEQGNTPELLKKVYDKYTELWLYQLMFNVESLPKVIGRLLQYPNND